MNTNRTIVAAVLAGFTALNVYVLSEHSIVELFELVLANSATTLAFVDLLIALSLVSVWIWQDARAHDTSPWPYLIITALTGSIGPLLYLLRRPADSAPRLTARGYERHAIARGTSLRGRRFF